jgi:hypothetical protein
MCINFAPKVVSNSSPLIYLAKISKLDLIRDIYSRVWISEAVFNETVTKGKALKITDASIIEEAAGKWILIKTIDSETSQKYAFLDENDKIGLGEKQALKLCKQINADTLIADDKEARRTARLLRIKSIGSCGILIQAHKKGLISTSEAQQALNDLIKAEFRIDPTVYQTIINKLRKAQPNKVKNQWKPSSLHRSFKN